MKPIRVLLADDHTILREGLHSLLAAEEGYEIVGEANDGREAVQMVEQTKPDVVVMDISMKGLNGLEATHQIVRRSPETKVVILSIHGEESYVSLALRAGASGYVVKVSAYDELKQAIQAARRGEIYLSPAISPPIVEGYLENVALKDAAAVYDRLTPRQRELLQLIAEGYARKEIAALLQISPKTVSRHREDLMRNIGVDNDADLVKFALSVGVVST